MAEDAGHAHGAPCGSHGLSDNISGNRCLVQSVYDHIGNEKKRKSNRVDTPDMVSENVGGRDRFVRALLAAVRSLQSGKRKTGLLAVVGALGFGFNATACFCGLNKTLGIDTTDE